MRSLHMESTRDGFFLKAVFRRPLMELLNDLAAARRIGSFRAISLFSISESMGTALRVSKRLRAL